MDKKIADILETQDYSMFKHLEGNRTDATIRGAKIIESIRKNGYILSPIAVNEHYEVIDGQGRLYALECEGLPVHYYIVPGAGIEDCIAMNIYGTKWKLIDYIDSYANRGFDSYMKLKLLIEQYSGFDLSLILTAATDIYGSNSIGYSLRDGTFELSDEAVEKAERRLKYCKKVYKIVSENIKGKKTYFYQALIFIFDQCEGDFDRDKVITKIELLCHQIPAIADIQSALKSISEIYNYKNRGERMYFDVEYDKFMSATVPGYNSRWSKAKK